MVTQQQINTEIDLAKRIYLYYFDKMADLMSVGSDKSIKWYKDLCLIYFITKAMLSVYIVDDLLYSGDTEIDEDDWNSMRSDIREYLNYEIREVVYSDLYSDGNIKDVYIPPTPPTIIVYSTSPTEWRTVTITVAIDDANTLTLPFNISDVDEDTVMITVNDNEPILLSDPSEEGCHIVGTTLSWHTYYNLKAGDRVFVRYRINL